MEDAIYGGRVDNAYDLRVLRTYLRYLYCTFAIVRAPLIALSRGSLFFSDRIASDKGAGHEIISGTPLKMPSHAEYEAFRKVVAQVSFRCYCCVKRPKVYLVVCDF